MLPYRCRTMLRRSRPRRRRILPQARVLLKRVPEALDRGRVRERRGAQLGDLSTRRAAEQLRPRGKKNGREEVSPVVPVYGLAAFASVLGTCKRARSSGRSRFFTPMTFSRPFTASPNAQRAQSVFSGQAAARSAAPGLAPKAYGSRRAGPGVARGARARLLRRTGSPWRRPAGPRR